MKDTSSREIVSESFEIGLYLAYYLVETDVETIFTDKMLDYYCIELQRFFPMLDRDASPVLEIEGILVQKVPIPPPPSEETYRRIGTFYYRGPATIIGYSFDVERYRSTFEEEGEETETFDMAKFWSAFQEIGRETEKFLAAVEKYWSTSNVKRGKTENMQGYKDAWNKDIEYKQITLV